MNTHDIELPPLPSGHPTYEFPDGAYDSEQMHQYARAAIEADRKRQYRPVYEEGWRDALEWASKRRGEPVAWLVRDDMLGTWLFRSEKPEPGLWKYVKPLYDTPQPADPVKVPSDADLFAIHDEHFPTMVLGHDNYLRFARALLERYGTT